MRVHQLSVADKALSVSRAADRRFNSCLPVEKPMRRQGQMRTSRDQQLDWVPAALVAHWLRTPELEVLTAAENCSFGRKRPTDSVPVHEFGDPKTVVK